MCSYTQCVYNITIPIPPQLKSLSFHNFGTFNQIINKVPNPDTRVTLCIHSNNNLEVIDMRNVDIAWQQVFPGFSFQLSGLQKLKYLNIQSHKLPFLLSKVVLQDTDSLVELHIGGGKVSENDIFTAKQLQTFTQLSMLNLSRASLLGIEADSFINNKHLSVLDLSYNCLNSSSLTSVDLSQTKMKSLNLFSQSVSF